LQRDSTEVGKKLRNTGSLNVGVYKFYITAMFRVNCIPDLFFPDHLTYESLFKREEKKVIEIITINVTVTMGILV
jgi:hypothetical protein